MKTVLRFLSVTLRAMVLLASGCLLLGHPVLAADDYSDGFEGDALNPFWTQTAINASIAIQSSGPVHSGSKAVKLDTTNWGQKTAILSHIFSQPQYGKVSVWFYDQMQYIYFYMILSNTASGQSVGSGVQDWDYSAYYSLGGLTSVPRSVGWHQFVIEFTESTLKASVDGQVVYVGAGGAQFDKVALQMTGPGWGGMLFDDFLFESSRKPRLVVEQPAGSAVSSGDLRDFGTSIVGESQILTITIKNTGQAVLTGLGASSTGANAADFTVASVIPSQLAAGENTSFDLRFAPSSGGAKSAVLHISSNDPDHNPFDIQLAGLGLSTTNDTDGDGMNDAAEFKLAALGFDWQVSQPELVSTYFANASQCGLMTGDQVRALHAGKTLLGRDPTSGRIKLTLGLRKSTDLLHFSSLPITASQASVTADGKLEYQFSSPERAAFFRLEAK